MFREDVTRSVDRIGHEALGVAWFLLRGNVAAAMAKKSDGELRRLLVVIHEEAARLRERFP